MFHAKFKSSFSLNTEQHAASTHACEGMQKFNAMRLGFQIAGARMASNLGPHLEDLVLVLGLCSKIIKPGLCSGCSLFLLGLQLVLEGLQVLDA